MINNKKGVVGKKKSVRTPENIHYFEQALIQSFSKSIKHLSQQLNFAALSACR
jgi:hypothetical protein